MPFNYNMMGDKVLLNFAAKFQREITKLLWQRLAENYRYNKQVKTRGGERNRPFRSCLLPSIKTSLSLKPWKCVPPTGSFLCKSNSFFTLRLVLMQRHKGSEMAYLSRMTLIRVGLFTNFTRRHLISHTKTGACDMLLTKTIIPF